MNNTIPRRSISRLFAYVLAKSGLEDLPSDRHILHGILHELAKKDDYKALLEDFEFSSNDIFPFSSDFENVLNSLHLGRILTAKNPEYAWFSVNKNLVDHEEIGKAYAGDLEVLERLANEFSQSIEARTGVSKETPVVVS